MGGTVGFSIPAPTIPRRSAPAARIRQGQLGLARFSASAAARFQPGHLLRFSGRRHRFRHRTRQPGPEGRFSAERPHRGDRRQAGHGRHQRGDAGIPPHARSPAVRQAGRLHRRPRGENGCDRRRPGSPKARLKAKRSPARAGDSPPRRSTVSTRRISITTVIPASISTAFRISAMRRRPSCGRTTFSFRSTGNRSIPPPNSKRSTGKRWSGSIRIRRRRSPCFATDA